MNKTQKMLGNLQKGLLFIVSAPAGTGKTTMVEMLQKEFPCVVESISSTTRLPREGEIDGVHYRFLGKERFEKQTSEGEFLEHVELYGQYYGTSRKWVAEQQCEGKHVILVIDTQGALKLKGKIPSTLIFIRPPSLEELDRRLRDRKTESEERIAERLEWAKQEIAVGSQYDYQIVNDNLETAYQVLKSILIAEEHRTKNL